jgi:hypothetical protein
MAVKRLDQNGQSIIEMLIMLPLMIALVVLVVQVNSVIQVSIVNQKVARSHALWLAFNSPIYPELKFQRVHNEMVMGVSENKSPRLGEEDYVPEAQVMMVSRSRSLAGDPTADRNKEPLKRGWIRVRNTVALCTSSLVVSVGGLVPPTPAVMTETRFKGGQQFAFCEPPVDGGAP